MSTYAVPRILIRIAIPFAWLAWVLTFAQAQGEVSSPSIGTMAVIGTRCFLWAAICHCGLAGIRALFDIAGHVERTANASERRGAPVKPPAFSPPP